MLTNSWLRERRTQEKGKAVDGRYNASAKGRANRARARYKAKQVAHAQRP